MLVHKSLDGLFFLGGGAYTPTKVCMCVCGVREEVARKLCDVCGHDSFVQLFDGRQQV